MRALIVLVLALGCGGTTTTTTTTPAAPVSPPPGAPAKPPSVELSAEVLPPHGTLMLGDLHGTREIPAFVGRALAAAAEREPVVFGLEITTDNQAAIDAYLASDGGPEARRRLIAGPWWQVAYQDGRRSVALAELLETIRGLRAAGRRIDVVAIDDPAPDAEAREEAMARHVLAARRANRDAALIVYAGNLHTRKAEAPFQRGFAWMAMRVVAAGIPVVSLDTRWADGTAWICRDAVAEHCGVSFVGGRGTELGIRLAPSRDGAYDGWFGVGSVTASPPASRPDLAVGLEAKIAAAGSSPQAVRARARRAYDAKRYGECADLLATVASPDGGIAYDHACCLALAGRKDEALAKLRYAIGAGFQDFAHMEADPDLASLRGDPRWPIKR